MGNEHNYVPPDSMGVGGGVSFSAPTPIDSGDTYACCPLPKPPILGISNHWL